MNYRKNYKLEERIFDEPFHFESPLNLLTDGITNLGEYSLRNKNSNDFVIFGREGRGEILMSSNDALLILKKEKNGGETPVIALRYGIYPDKIVVGYIQTPFDINLKDYKKIKLELEVRPHELIFSHFLEKVSPFLNKFPKTDLSFSQTYIRYSPYAPIRDRFLDKNYFLNPNKERVKQILGEKNQWLLKEKIEERNFPEKRPTYKRDLFI